MSHSEIEDLSTRRRKSISLLLIEVFEMVRLIYFFLTFLVFFGSALEGFCADRFGEERSVADMLMNH